MRVAILKILKDYHQKRKSTIITPNSSHLQKN